MKYNTQAKILTAHSVVLGALLILPSVAFAQNFVPLNPIPNFIETGNASNLPAFFNGLYRLCIGAAATIAVLQIMRAGFKFIVDKGSVSSNEAAKSLIQNSILGLVLVLSPAIIFGIINPKILDLRLDVAGLQPKATDPAPSTATPTTTSGAKSLPSNCSLYTNPTTVPQLRSCSLEGATFVQVSNSCCSAQPGFTCCARPKSSTPVAAAAEFMWRVTVKGSLTGGTVFAPPKPEIAQGGPFKTKEECSISYAAFDLSRDAETVECNCSKPRSEFKACRE